MKLRGLIGAAVLAAGVLTPLAGAGPAGATPARRGCSYRVHTYWAGGSAGYASAWFSYLSGCGPWQVKIRCRNTNGTTVWRYSQIAYDTREHSAGCYSDQTAGLAYWTGFWNDREHQMSP